MDILKRILKLGVRKVEKTTKVKRMNLTAYGNTDTGQKRKNNEDYYLLMPELDIFMVADGMGGYNAGEVASQSAVKAISGYFTPERISAMQENRENVEAELVNGVTEAHKKIVEMSRIKMEHTGMGSTMAISFIYDDTLHTCHVGDSRVYVVNPSGITQVTHDHSPVAEMVKLGTMTREEARKSPLKNQITQALGAPFPVIPEYNQHELNKGDRVLLCSDGLWDMLSDEEIQAVVLAGGTPEDACMELIQQANAAGGADNITVIVVFIDGDTDTVAAADEDADKADEDEGIVKNENSGKDEATDKDGDETP
jgi:serine/threonine protein phosphatase PrpC